MNTETITFLILAVGAVGSALLMITRRSPMLSVLYLIAHFFVLAIIYLTLQAQFIAVIQILVYAGAIMVLFLFVIMLLNLGDEKRLTEKLTTNKIIAGLVSLMVLGQISIVLLIGLPDSRTALSEKALQVGMAENIGRELFSKFLFPFEVTSILLLAAMVGVVVLAKKKFH